MMMSMGRRTAAHYCIDARGRHVKLPSMSEPSGARGVQLHVIHDLGGGAARWLADFLRADTSRRNIVLKSITHDANAGGGVALYDSSDVENPRRVWTFREPIAAVAVQHAEYQAALREVIGSEGVGGLI